MLHKYVESELVNAIDDALIATDSDGTVHVWNDAAIRLYGWTRDEAIGLNIRELTVSPSERETSEQIMETLNRGQTWEGDFIVRDKQGKAFLARVRNRPIFDEQGAVVGILGLSRDITQARTLPKASTYEVGVWVDDFINGYATWSEEVYRLLGASAGDEQPRATLTYQLHPDDVDQVKNALANSARGQISVERRVDLPDGPRWLAIRGEYLYEGGAEETADPLGAVGVIFDISEQRRVIQELTTAGAIRDDVIELVSHEIRTPLTILLGLSRHAARRAEGIDSELSNMLQDVLRYGQQLHSSLEDMVMLSHAGLDGASLEPVLLQRFVPKELEALASSYEDRDFEYNLLDHPAPVEANPEWLTQIFENVIRNADAHNPIGEPIAVDLGVRGDRAFIAIADRGRGISADDTERIFEPFYRAPSTAGSGMGLGLTVCKRLAALQGGDITVRPRDGGGSIFELTLPMVLPSETELSTGS